MYDPIDYGRTAPPDHLTVQRLLDTHQRILEYVQHLTSTVTSISMALSSMSRRFDEVIESNTLEAAFQRRRADEWERVAKHAGSA